MWLLFGLLSALFSALMSIFIKVGLKEINPFLSLFVRTLLVTIICAIVCFKNKSFKEIKVMTLSNWKWIILASIFTFLTWLFYFLALKKGEVQKVMALDKMSIIITIIIGLIFFQEKLTLFTIIGAILILIGSVFIIL